MDNVTKKLVGLLGDLSEVISDFQKAASGYPAFVIAGNEAISKANGLLDALSYYDHTVDGGNPFTQMDVVTEPITESGPIVSFDTKLNSSRPIDALIVDIDPVQSGSGDPSPDNVRPISGWDSVKVMRAKKNLWNPSDVFTGFINNNTHTIQSNSACKICYICATPNTTYTISKMAGARFAVACSDVEPALNAPVYGEILNYNATSITITTTNSTKYLLAWCYLGGTDTATEAEMLASVQIELGSSATEYEPYDGNTYDISLTSTGTVYGGTLDVVSGELTVDKAILDMGTANWSYASGAKIFYRNQTDGMSPLAGGDVSALCSCYPRKTYATRMDKCFWVSDTAFSSAKRVAVIDNDYDDATAFKAAMAGQKIVYTLATPLTYQLTATEIKSLLGINNVWADAGDVTVTYQARSDKDCNGGHPGVS